MNIGDRVTVVRMFYTRIFAQVAHVRVSRCWPDGDAFDGEAEAGGLVTRRVQDEGVTWIRGHWEENTEEVRALLAAYALVRT